jgi:hypothetical protein
MKAKNGVSGVVRIGEDALGDAEAPKEITHRIHRRDEFYDDGKC